MKLRIKNAMFLDLTELTEETANNIEAIDHCMMALFSQESSALQSKIAFDNLMMSAVVPAGVRPRIVNGSERIGWAEAETSAPVYYVINGKLTIDAEVSPAQLRRMLAGGILNGKVLCTNGQAEVLRAAGFSVNGKVVSYPDDAELHVGDLTIDEGFASCAVPGKRYFVTGKVSALTQGMDVLAQKGVRIQGASLIVREHNVQAAQAVWCGSVSAVRPIPEGLAYVEKSLMLDRVALRRYGKALYVDGNCFVAESLTAQQLQNGLTKLMVAGCVVTPEGLLDPLLDVCGDYADLVAYDGRLLVNKEVLEISAATLEGFDHPVSLWHEGVLTIDADVSVAMLREKIEGIYLFGEVCVPKALHGTVLSLAKRMEGHITVAGRERAQQPEEAQADVRIIENVMEMKLV